jgi:hypothetical protein
MSHAPARIILDVALTIVVSLLVLGLWQALLGASLTDGFGEGARLLFLFMDVGLAVWVILLVIFAVRRRPLGVGRTLLFAVIGALANLLTVIVVGIIQQGWAPLFILFATEAGIAFLVAAGIAVSVVHRVILRPAVPA